MKTTSAPKKRPASQRAALLNRIPGWTKVGQMDIPLEIFEKRRDNGRFRESTEPLQVFKTLLLTIWHAVGRVERGAMYPDACTARALTDAMRAWAPSYADDCILRKVWRSYMGLLTSAQRKQWRAKFDVQLDSWRDWETASIFAARVHTVWFHVLANEAGCR